MQRGQTWRCEMLRKTERPPLSFLNNLSSGMHHDGNSLPLSLSLFLSLRLFIANVGRYWKIQFLQNGPHCITTACTVSVCIGGRHRMGADRHLVSSPSLVYNKQSRCDLKLFMTKHEEAALLEIGLEFPLIRISQNNLLCDAGDALTLSWHFTLYPLDNTKSGEWSKYSVCLLATLVTWDGWKGPLCFRLGFFNSIVSHFLISYQLTTVTFCCLT